MGVYTCETCPHKNILFCHNCTNESESPLLHEHHNDVDEIKAKIIEEFLKELNAPGVEGLHKYLVVCCDGFNYLNHIVQAPTKINVVQWFVENHDPRCKIVNIIQL